MVPYQFSVKGSSSMFCPNCGKSLKDDARFCMRCGAQIPASKKDSSSKPLEPVNIPPSPAPTTIISPIVPDKRPIKPFLIVFFVIVVAILSIFLFQSHTDEAIPQDLAVQESDNILSNTSSNDDIKSVYSGVISRLHEKYGIGSYSEHGEPRGLVIVREIDFDQDGKLELFCAFANPNMRNKDQPDGSELDPKCNGMNCTYCYEIWGTQNDVPVQIYHGPILFSDTSFRIDFVRLNGQIYYRNFYASGANRYTRFWTLQSGNWVQSKVLSTFDFIDFIIDGRVSSSEEYEKESQFWSGAQEYMSCAFFDGQEELEKTKVLLQNMGIEIKADTPQKIEFVNLMEYIGDWYIQNINNAGFSILVEDGTYFVSASAAYNNGNYLVMIDPVPLNLSGNIASAEYDDDGRGHHGTIQLEFQKDVLYATVTAIAGEWGDQWDMAMEDELCTRTAPYFEDDTSDSGDDYWLDSQYINEGLLSEATREDIMWTRNEIYARHGYIFQDKEIQSIFEATDWYIPNPYYSDDLLNEIEHVNIDILVSYEREMGWRN